MMFDRDVFYNAGRAAALDLRGAAHSMTGTEIIDRERDAPTFDPQRDYTSWPAGAPVCDDGQVWLLLQPYNAANYPQRPAELRALWGLAHTTKPAKAKPWVAPFGTSGMYMRGECYRDDNGTVWRCLRDDVIHPASALPDAWEAVANA